MNKKNNLYVVLFGSDRFDPEAHLRAARHTFNFITDARRYSQQYSNAGIFKFHFNSNSGDVEWFCEVR